MSDTLSLSETLYGWLSRANRVMLRLDGRSFHVAVVCESLDYPRDYEVESGFLETLRVLQHERIHGVAKLPVGNAWRHAYTFSDHGGIIRPDDVAKAYLVADLRC